MSNEDIIRYILLLSLGQSMSNKMGFLNIYRALLSMDSKEELPMDMVEQLLKFIPTNEERALLDERSSDLDSLSRADRFLYDVSKYVYVLMCTLV